MKIALAQFNPTVGDFEGNAVRILSLAEQARQRAADLAVFSELCLCGYPPQDLLERPAFLEQNLTQINRLAEKIPLTSIVGYVGRSKEGSGKPAANAAALIGNGKILFEQQKMLLPTYDVFDELRYFQPARSQQVFLLGGLKVGLTICEDIWNDKTFWAKPMYERDPVSELVEQGSQVILNISASPYTLNKRILRLEMLKALAKHHGRPVVYVNQVGGNDQLVFDGSSVAVLPNGRIAAQARSFEEDLVVFDTETGQGELRSQPEDELEAAYQALVLGTRDYLAKCGFQKAVIGLSGGIDSAVVTAIAVAAVGRQNVLTVAMPGPYSSTSSLEDARRVAENLKVQLTVIPIHDIYQSYLNTLQSCFEGTTRDVTEENIQARIRGNILMALSNKFGFLVLSTGNKSELAAGYCTLYGDMAGGLAVLSDVPKTMVYELARLINRKSQLQGDTPPIPESILTKPPSAELRPNQTDQDTLPPYDILDRILRAYVEDLRDPEQIAQNFSYPPNLVWEVVERINRNEYKRKQAPPGIKITSKAFGLGRRLPIAHKFRG
jgi:NAD+ synthetase